MGPKALLADFTSKWCSGSTESFDLSGEGSSPFFLRSGGDFNPHSTLYQSGPLIQARLLIITGEEDLQGRQGVQGVREP